MTNDRFLGIGNDVFEIDRHHRFIIHVNVLHHIAHSNETIVGRLSCSQIALSSYYTYFNEPRLLIERDLSFARYS